MKIKEKIYERLPIFLQNYACYFEGKKIFARRYSQLFFNKLEKIKKRDLLSKRELDNLIQKRLKKQLILAYENSIYYKKLFDNCSFDPYKFNTVHDLRKLPIHTKSDFQSNISEMINNSIDNKMYIYSHTSGTTGTGLVFPETIDCENEKWSIWWRYRINNGINFNKRCAYFGGKSIVPLKQTNPPFWRNVEPTKQLMFSMYHLNSKTVNYYVSEINKKKIEWLHGYPSTLSYLASLMYEKKLEFNHRINYLTIGSESLLKYQKEIMYKVFNIYPIQHYGLTEPVANISQCEYGKLHIDEDYSYVELIPINNMENKYKLIGTSFANDSLLFLRYDTNDIVTLSTKQTCKCGRIGRIIDEIDGRNEDFLIQKDDSKIGRLDHIFKDMINIKEAQIIQKKDKSVIFKIVKGDNYSTSDKENLIYEIESRLNIDYLIEYVDKISKSKSGKLKFVKSEI